MGDEKFNYTIYRKMYGCHLPLYTSLVLEVHEKIFKLKAQKISLKADFQSNFQNQFNHLIDSRKCNKTLLSAKPILIAL